jgi:hypothetical protein
MDLRGLARATLPLLAFATLTLVACTEPAAGNSAAPPPAAQPARSKPLRFEYSDTQSWLLFDALLLTGVTGTRTTVPMGSDKLEIHQVEKTDACSHIISEAWINGEKPTDDRLLQPYVVCPLSTAPSAHKGGEKWLMKVLEADLTFKPISKPVGLAADVFPSARGLKNFIRLEVTVMINDDGSRNGRRTYTAWRDIGERYVLADFAIPDEAIVDRE